jgi:hypothetical protein
MEVTLLKSILDKSDWLIVTIFVLWILFQLVMYYLKQKKGIKTEDSLQKQFTKTIDSIDNKLKIIYAQYGCELSKEAAILIIQNFYFNYANAIADEIYKHQKKEISNNKITSYIENRMSILNDEKMQELDLFIYRNRHLVTYTTGKIVDAEKIIKAINSYSDKNGMLREEIQNILSIESGIVVKRLN